MNTNPTPQASGQTLIVIEAALKAAHHDYSKLRQGQVPDYFSLEAGTQACEAAMAALHDLQCANRV